MAANKYLEHDLAGGMREKVATIVSTGSNEEGDIVALDATGRLDNSIMPVGIGEDAAIVQCSEDLAAGDWVNIWDDSGNPRVRKADATTTGKDVTGFVLNSATSGTNANVFFEGTNTVENALSPGQVLYLSTTAGSSTHTPPTTSGNVVQKIGRALSETSAQFEPSNPIELV